MITIDQAMRGAVRFFDAVAAPHMSDAVAFLSGVGLSLLASGTKQDLLVLKDNLWIKAMRVMDETGNIDIDRLYDAARSRIDGKKITVPIPIIGDLTFLPDDLDKLYKYMQEA